MLSACAEFMRAKARMGRGKPMAGHSSVVTFPFEDNGTFVQSILGCATRVILVLQREGVAE